MWLAAHVALVLGAAVVLVAVVVIAGQALGAGDCTVIHIRGR